MTCQQNQPASRKQPIIRLDLTTEMKLVWKLSPAAGLPRFAHKRGTGGSNGFLFLPLRHILQTKHAYNCMRQNREKNR